MLDIAAEFIKHNADFEQIAKIYNMSKPFIILRWKIQKQISQYKKNQQKLILQNLEKQKEDNN